MEVNGKNYEIVKMIGHGKGGYSYLAKAGSTFVVAKQIHHEPCAYYQFGNKIEAELSDYKRLVSIGISIPKLLDFDVAKEIIVKEYIEGPTVFDLVKNHRDVEQYITQVREMAELAKSNGLNIDYFPTNFVVSNHVLFYIDYECNEYMEEWNFDNWGIKYWSYSKEFEEHLKKDKI